MQSADDKNNKDTDKLIIADADSLARKIQRVMIPESLPSLEGIDIRSLFLPSGRKGGDLFDVMNVSDDVVALLMFDIASEEIEPVLVSAMAKICFVKHVSQQVLPYAVIERVNSELFRHVGRNLNLSAFIGYLDLHDLKLTYCNTSATEPLLFRRDEGVIERLSGDHVSIGAEVEIHHEEQYVYLRQGDELLIYTDGLSTLLGGSTGDDANVSNEWLQEKFNESTLCDVLKSIQDIFYTRQRTDAIADDVSVVAVEVLTQSKKNLIKDRLGFKSTDKVYLQFLRYLEEMDRTTATILTALDIAGFRDEDIRKMKIVLTELLVNAIVHGNKKDHSRKVTVGHLIDPQKAIVSILDEGDGFDPGVIPDPTLPENLEKPCGRGLFIVRHYVESVQFNASGNRVTIIKKNLLE